MPNPNFDQILTTTTQKLLGKVEHSAFRRVAFAAELTRKNRVSKNATGAYIQVPVNFSLAQGGSSYSGYDNLSTEVWQSHTSARYDWKQYQIPIMLDGRTIRLNGGPEAAIKLLPEKMQIAEKSLMENLNGIWLGAGNGNGGKDFLGIGTLIGDSSDTVTTVGGIPCTGTNAEANWQSHVQRNAGNYTTVDGTGNVAMFAGLKRIRRAITTTTYGTQGPQALFSNQDLFDAVYNSFLPQVRLEDTEMANMGFDNVKVYNKPLYFDEMIPAGPGGDLILYGVDFEALKLYGHPDAWFTTTGWFTPDHKDSKWCYILLQGELTISNRRTSFRIEFDGI